MSVISISYLFLIYFQVLNSLIQRIFMHQALARLWSYNVDQLPVSWN